MTYLDRKCTSRRVGTIPNCCGFLCFDKKKCGFALKMLLLHPEIFFPSTEHIWQKYFDNVTNNYKCETSEFRYMMMLHL